jgi:DNA replication protein DnaC
LALARADDSYTKLLAPLAKAHLLVLDDFGLSPLTDTERHGYIIAH